MLRSLDSDSPVPITHVDMTRFWMHIADAAKMVQWTIDNMLGGETVIPKIKAAKVTRLAEMILPGRNQIDVGIRPGEKLHEQLFDRREHERTWECGTYYAVLPESDEFNHIKREYGKSRNLTTRTSYYSSDDDLQMIDSELEEVCRGEH